ESTGTITEYTELKPTLRHVILLYRQFLQNNMHLLQQSAPISSSTGTTATVSSTVSGPSSTKAAAMVDNDVLDTLKNTFLLSYLPNILVKRFHTAMNNYGFVSSSNNNNSNDIMHTMQQQHGNNQHVSGNMNMGSNNSSTKH